MLKPASATPLSALLLAELMDEAGLPAGWLNVVVGSSSEIGDVLVEDERVAALTFTGSGDVGWKLKERAPRKHVALELGNATPVIVCADAPEGTAATLAANALLVRRPELHLGPADLRRSTTRGTASSPSSCRRSRRLQVGDPADEETDVGPVIDDDARERILAWIAEAGGELLTGGDTTDDGLIRPTVIANPSPDAKVSCEEVFGPVVTLTRVGSLDEAIELANSTRYGLQAGIFTSEPQVRARSGARRSSSAASRSTRRRRSAPTRCPTAA